MEAWLADRSRQAAVLGDFAGKGNAVAEANPAGAVVEIAATDAHVVEDVAGDGDGEAHPENSMSEGQGVEAAVAQEERAGDGSPEEGERNENRVRDVGEGEEECGEDYSRDAGEAETQQAKQDVNLQDELLHEGPERVLEDVLEGGQRSIEVVEGVQALSGKHGGGGEGERGGDDPERWEEAAEAEAEGFRSPAREDGGQGDPGESDPVEDALGRVGGPDDGEDEGVADGQFSDVAGAG